VSATPPAASPARAIRTATYAGLGLCVIGLGLIVVAWGVVAGQTQLDKQLLPIVAAAVPGVAVIMIGVTVIALAARRSDRYARARQVDRLAALLEERS
jgi:hypothetical protein